MNMKMSLKKMLPLLLIAGILTAGMSMVSCKSSSRSGERMYERHQSNKGTKVKSNIKVRGSNKANGHTTRSY